MSIRWAALINSGFWRTLDWIYPPNCASCGEPGFRLCADCFASIRTIRGKRCAVCGEPGVRSGVACKVCQQSPPSYNAVRNLAHYEGVMRACVHALKYENNPGLGECFAENLADLVRESGWSADLVIPVPLSQQRYSQRGYNQAACIAKPLAARLGIRYHPFGLERTRDTPSQVGLSAIERRANVIGAFKALPELVIDQRVLVVDDVMTTGSTLEACAQALRAAGSGAVYGLSLGRFSRQGHEAGDYDPASCIIEATN